MASSPPRPAPATADSSATGNVLAIALTRPENAVVFGSYAAIALLVGTVLPYRRVNN